MYVCHTLLCAYRTFVRSFMFVVPGCVGAYAKRSPLATSGEFKTEINAFVLGLGSNFCVEYTDVLDFFGAVLHGGLQSGRADCESSCIQDPML